jgi:N-acetylglutamate synthase-like GNAT family acetyltransferase
MVADSVSIRVARKQDLNAMLDLIRQHQRYDVEFARRYCAKYFEGIGIVKEDEVLLLLSTPGL